MREILFRGKLVYNGTWVYGGFYKEPVDDIKDGKVYIITASLESVGNANEVIPESIGQFTGLVDKHGKRIFEGDIISTDLARDFLVVEFKGGAFVFNCNDGDDDYYDHINASNELDNEYKYGEVIGNIHDNHNILEEK